MVIFEPGNYCGNVDTLVGDGELVASITRYHSSLFNRELHYHENAHLSFVLAGGCAERKRSAYERLPGQIVYYHAGEEHQMLTVDDRSRYVNLELSNDFFRHYDLEPGCIVQALRHPYMKLLLVKIYGDLLKRDRFSATSIEAELLALLSKPVFTVKGSGRPDWVQKADHLLHEEGQVSFTLDDLALATGVHPVTISRYFKQYFGCTLGEYRRKLQAEKALVLFSSGKTIPEVVFMCGFYDQSHMIRIFKQQTGLLPFLFQKSTR